MSVTWLDAQLDEILLAWHLGKDDQARELEEKLRADVRQRIRGAVGALAIEIAYGNKSVIGTSDLERLTDEAMADDSYEIVFD